MLNPLNYHQSTCYFGAVPMALPERRKFVRDMVQGKAAKIPPAPRPLKGAVKMDRGGLMIIIIMIVYDPILMAS